MNSVDFGVKRTSLQAWLANKAAILPIKEVAASSQPELVYFRAQFPTSGFTIGTRRVMFGIPTPYWHITSDPEEIAYFRKEFGQLSNSDIKIEEWDKYTFEVATITQKEILPNITSSEG